MYNTTTTKIIIIRSKNEALRPDEIQGPINNIAELVF